MGLRENIDWGERAVAVVKRYVQYSSNNQRADLVASKMQEFDAWKFQNAEYNKAVAAGSMIGHTASVANKVAFFTQAATLAPAPAPLPRGPRFDVFQQPNEINARMNSLREVNPLIVADGTGAAGRSTTQYFYDTLRAQGERRNYHSWIMAMAWAARHEGAGNCGELAAIAFMYLEEEGVRPLDYMVFTAPSYDHVWLVIGRAAGSRVLDLSTWGEDAVWCDPWQLREGRVYSIQDLIKMKATNLDAAYKLNSVGLVQAGLPKTEWRSA
jgi:hypothetical protein